MILIPLCIGLIIGMIIGRILDPDSNDCPAVETGYRCSGRTCDHRKSLLYEAKMHNALNRERPDRPGGNGHA